MISVLQKHKNFKSLVINTQCLNLELKMYVNIGEIIGGIARFLPHVFQITFIQHVIPIMASRSQIEYLKHIPRLHN